MTLVQLRHLIAIVDAGLNLTVAAERVHATQPGLSKQLRALEDELGFPVFLRNGKRLTGLTELGSEVAARARLIVDQARSIRAFAANTRAETQGELRLVCTHTLARFVLPEALGELRRRYPRVRLAIETTDPGRIIEALGGGDVDVALSSSAGLPPESGLAVPLFRWRRVALVPANHALAGRSVLRLADLAQHPLLVYPSTVRPGSSLAEAFADQGLHPEYAVTASDAELIRTYVEQGIGIGVVADLAAHRLPPSVRAIPLEQAVAACTTYALLPANRVPRDFTLELLHGLAPQLDLAALRRVLAGLEKPDFAEAGWFGKTGMGSDPHAT
jgi:LysR family transcriptional regulator, cys regulon transcriptional activator